MRFKLTLIIFISLLFACENDDSNGIPIDETGLVGEWLLTASYVSPGGTTEWKDVDEGYRYIFDEFGNYERTTFNKETINSGSYEIIERELYLYSIIEEARDTLGFTADFNESKTRLTLSPSYPGICIEGCLYRFDKE